MLIDESGNRYGRLLVRERADNANDGEARWLCACECGNSAVVRGVMLRQGRTRSCGCLYRESRSSIALSHGLARRGAVAPELYVWESMRQRCLNPKNHAYHRYGGAGIRICDRWAESFSNFIADMGRRPDGKSIDRIDNTKGYEPSNCRWATAKEQSANKRPLAERKSSKPSNTGHVGIRMLPSGIYRVSCSGRHVGQTRDFCEAVDMRRRAEEAHEADRVAKIRAMEKTISEGHPHGRPTAADQVDPGPRRDDPAGDSAHGAPSADGDGRARPGR